MNRLASLFTEDGVVRIPYINAEAVSRQEIRAGVERLQGLWDYFVQTTHPGTIQLEGDTAVGRAYISEFGHLRLYEVRYLDTTELSGSAPPAAGAPAKEPTENTSSTKGSR